MTTFAALHPGWHTACNDQPADTSTIDLMSLDEHLGACRAAPGRLFALRGLAQALHGFVVTRFVTTLVFVAILFALNSWLV
jgi:hypothetical protein